MYFPFNATKAAEVAAELILRSGGRINVMKLVKLVYLLDRLSISKRGIPVLGGFYLSMKNGPVISELLDLINSGRLAEERDHVWEQLIEPRKDYEISLRHELKQRQWLSDGEVELINEIWQEHGHKDQWQLRDYCHDHCPEWTRLGKGTMPIMLRNIGKALGKSDAQRARMAAEARELSQLSSIFA